MSLKVKICGIQSIEEAITSIRAGADFLGFNIVRGSRRYTDPYRAKKIINDIYHKVMVVGVFQNEAIETVNDLSFYLCLDFVQLHGDEGSKYLEKIKVPVIKVLRFKRDFHDGDINQAIKRYPADIFLLDREKQGEGEALPINNIKEMRKDKLFFLAGGLTIKNVRHVVESARPFGVDVAGGVETNGKKDSAKLTAFIKEARGENYAF